MEEEIEQFTVGHEKPFPQDIKQLYWSNRMDLLAVVTSENILELHRISYKSQKVFHIEEINQIVSTCFSPDSYLLIYACDDGSMNIVKTENGKRLFSIDKMHKCQISTLDWVDLQVQCKIENLNMFSKGSQIDSFIIPIIPHEASEKKNVMKLNFLSEFNNKNDIRFLVTSDIASNLNISFNGLFTVCKFDLQQIVSNSNLSEPRSLSTLFLDDLSSFHIFISAKSSTNPSKDYLCFANIDTNIIHYYKEDIANIAYLMSYLDNMINFLNNSFMSLNKLILEVSRSYDAKMYIMEDLIKNNCSSNESGVIEKLPTVSEEFLRFLISGEYTPAIDQFLKKEVFDTNILEKMDQTLNKKIQSIQELITESMQSTVQRMMVVISQLESYAGQGNKYQTLGLDLNELRNLSLVVKQIFNLCDEVLVTATETKLSIRNLIVWLNRCVIKTFESDNDQEIQNHKFALKEFQVDVQRLHHFLSNEERFRLKDLRIYTENKVDLPIKDEDEIKGSLKMQKPGSRNPKSSTQFTSGVVQNNSQMQNKFDIAISSVIGSSSSSQSSNSRQFENSGLLQSQILDFVLNSINNQISNVSNMIQPFNVMVETREAMPKETHSSSILQKIPKSNLIIAAKNLEKQWSNIFLKMQNEIGNYTKKPLEIIRLCPLSSLTRFKQLHSFQEVVTQEYKVVQPGKIRNQNLIQLFRVKKVRKQTIIQVVFIKVPQNYDLKDMCFDQSNRLLVLLSKQIEEQMNQGAQDDTGLSEIHLIKDDDMKPSKEFMGNLVQNIQLSLIEQIQPTEIYLNEMKIIKTMRLQTSNCDNLQSSFRGLNSVVQETNKVIIFD
ncbi:hypothetical protein ABPG74_016415 [Tetrahymena malaccensis]